MATKKDKKSESGLDTRMNDAVFEITPAKKEKEEKKREV
tara:strand:- start:838 stop:954 length:117 start_codon:yes stop_codon:yes gene_type:complete